MLVEYIGEKMNNIRYFLGFWLWFSISVSGWAQPREEDFITDEMRSSIELTLETFQILDSLAEEVWPGWDANNLPPFFIGAPNNNAVFINPSSELPSGFIKSTYSNSNEIFIRGNSNMNAIFAGNAAVLDDTFFDVYSMYPYMKDSVHEYSMLLSRFYDDHLIESSVSNLLHSPEYYTSVTMHELFHYYQEKHKKYPMLYGNVEPRFNSKILAYSFIEGVILQEALYSEDHSKLNALVGQFIVVRDEKSKLLKEKQRKFEMVREFTEGCAQYTQTKMQEVLNRYSYHPVTSYTSVRELMFNNFNDFKLLDSLCLVVSTRQIEKDPGNRYYFYGQAQAKILDRMCGDQWKPEIINEDIFLVDLLKKYSNYRSENRAEYSKQIETRYDYDDILKKIKSNKREYIDD